MQFYQMFTKQLVLLKVGGVPVKADLRWLFVFVLISAVVASGIQHISGDWTSAAILGASTTLIFFISIFIHELAHAIAARIERIEVEEIVLHTFGGFTRFRDEPKTPRAEFTIAAAGPAASILLAILFGALAAAANAAGANVLVIIAITLAVGNMLIAIFNLLPGYPLDGGRILRAYLRRNGKDSSEATIITGRSGQLIAVLLIIVGLWVLLFRQELFIGSWAVLVGIFLYDSARSIINEVSIMDRMKVDDVMMLPISVPPDHTIFQFVENILPMYRQAAFPVAADRQLYGILLLEEMKNYGRSVWNETLISEIMIPVKTKHFVELGTPLTEARSIAKNNDIGAVCIIDAEGRLVGVVNQ